MNTQRIDTIFSRWQAQNAYPQTELIYHNSYQLLVAVILSAQSTDKMVNKVTEPLFAKIKTPQDMLRLDLPTLTHALNRLGLHQQKAKFILEMSSQLIMHHHGQIPQTREELEALPGVGRKTANVVLNSAFGQPVIAVDTHIFRVAHRLGLSSGKTPRQVEDDLMRTVPPRFLQFAHHWMILHGRYVCQAKKPNCQGCILKDLCYFRGKLLP